VSKPAALPNPLLAKILTRIAMTGAISMAEFMSIAMGDKEHGYYAQMPPFGRDGDFITAPEISQLFGELVAIWIFAAWQALGCPARFILCEGGPGRGTLSDDIIRTLMKAAPQCLSAAQIALMETSPALRRAQKEKLAKYDKPIIWMEDFSALASLPELRDLPLIFIANELLDVLPIHQYQNTPDGWRERLITANSECNDSAPALRFVLSLPQALPDFIPDSDFAALCASAPAGAIAETSPARSALISALSARIKQTRGAALLIDYGALKHGFGDTVQAVAKHKFTPVLENIGRSDLSSHVDFAALRAATEQAGCRAVSLTQGEFLLRLGLLERAGKLGANKSSAEQNQIRADVQRLAGSEAMGNLFKTLCIADKDTEMPPFAW